VKKTILSLAVLSTLGGISSYAQINQGGLPLSMNATESILSNQYLPTVSYEAPDLQTVLNGDEKASLMNPKPLRGGVMIPTDISFPQSGSLVTLANGNRVWRAQFQVTNAPAIGLYYDKFHLPAGVKYYITNANSKQVLGAFTEANNSTDGLFATEILQGNTAVLELDIDKNTSLDNIELHVNRTAYMYRGIDYLQQYADALAGTAARPTDFFTGGSASCEINAICPQGASFPNQRKAVARIVADLGDGYVGFCSSTLINNTKGDCTPYMLTATHCDGADSKVNSGFSQWTFYFNLETPTCAGGNSTGHNTMVGADFMARADYDSSASAIIGDFLLLKLRSNVPATYGAYLAGWNRSSTLSSTESFIGFHHPEGDYKKLSVGTGIEGNSTFNQNPVTTPNTHWYIHFTTGGDEPGSSGSGLFDSNGRLVGDLTGGPDVQICAAAGDTIMSNQSQYSKFTRNWAYPEGNGASNAQLKPWLDPANTDAMTVETIPDDATCSGGGTTVPSAISNVNTELGNAISIYPNPVTTGIVTMKINLAKQSDLNVVFYNVSGARVAMYNLSKVSTGSYTFNIGGYANGTYLMQISDGTATTSKKVMLMH
jgi:lysyl endopeptidase